MTARLDPVPADAYEALAAGGPALKEWHGLCSALAAGRQAVLLRKGGIHERGFDVREPVFYLFPTYLHQEPGKFRPGFRDLYAASAAENPGPDSVRIPAVAEVVGGAATTRREHLAALAAETAMTEEALALRYHWKPEQALHVLVVRVRPLVVPATVPMKPAYGGCRSWVKLGPVAGVELGPPARRDEQLLETLRRVREITGGAAAPAGAAPAASESTETPDRDP